MVRYRAAGWDGLKAKPIPGRPMKLTGHQRQGCIAPWRPRTPCR
ncbi:MAG: hypothetical protein IH977_12165 [Nitrospinae bacterium]|nr:hypothetical protein [Nitrospinota bacterium]